MATAGSIAALVEALEPFDEVEAEHRLDALAWLRSTADVFRRVAPRDPPKHLVAYVVLRDQDGSVLLVAHRRSGLWLPAGGHVEPGEDPARTATREVFEELGVVAPGCPSWRPVFLTVSETVGPPDSRHVDVSLWYVLPADRQALLQPDPREVTAARWWTLADLDTNPPERVEPHLGRFLAKIALMTTA